ncbi:hypothetical protein ACZ87_01411 [Candidatus Erwinia dacicola]|uniref:Uncharacterized protein n=1 Tax=Candidatus Erwinia dacicola TaxID=252393 RepID=A0A328TQS9_9GAMM|nr:hypothetical protein ACZ87_01411 [Candidatus Erwinia dacicola]
MSIFPPRKETIDPETNHSVEEKGASITVFASGTVCLPLTNRALLIER